MLKKYFELAEKVQTMFSEMETESKSLMIDSKMSCPTDCGQCCSNPEVEATPLEMLPLAIFLIKTKQAQEILINLEKSERDYCFFYHHKENDLSKGSCAIYQYRPTLCRLFGVASLGERYSVCKILKVKNVDAYQQLLEDKPQTTSMNEWSMRLGGLDPNLGREKMLINLALKMVLEKLVLLGLRED